MEREMMKKQNYYLRMAMVALASTALLASLPAEAKSPKQYTATPTSQKFFATPLVSTLATSPSDISSGWKVNLKTDLPNIDPDKIFVQSWGNTDLKQKGIVNNFFNIGNATLTATKKIPLKKGVRYKVELIYAMLFDPVDAGKASIDFNGTKVTATNETIPKDKTYTETITPTQDMDYTITINYKVTKKKAGYMKLAFNTDNGGGIVEDQIKAPTLNTTEANQKIMTGGGEAGNTVELTDSIGTVLGSGKVDENGSFTVTANRSFVYNEKIKAVQVTSSGNRGLEAETTIVDTIPPTVTINSIEHAATSISGKTEASATVVVKDSTDVVLGTSTANAAGDYTVKLSRPAIYNEKLTVEATDLAELTGNATAKVVDTIAPDAPILNALTDKDTKLTGTAEPNTKLDLHIGNDDYRVAVDKDGNFTVPFDEGKTYLGGTKLSATVTDSAHHTSEAAVATVAYSEAAAITISKPSPTTQDTSIDGETTRPNATVEIQIGYLVKQTITDDEGNFTYDFGVPHAIGTVITATLIDFDVQDSITVLPRIPTFNTTTAHLTTLDGHADPNADVEIKLFQSATPDTPLEFKVKANAAGEFSIKLQDKNGKEVALDIGDRLETLAHVSNWTSETGSYGVWAID